MRDTWLVKWHGDTYTLVWAPEQLADETDTLTTPEGEGIVGIILQDSDTGEVAQYDFVSDVHRAGFFRRRGRLTAI
jgi:hypothetical protein